MTIQKIYPAIQLFQGKLEEIPIFDGEKHGFRLRFSLARKSMDNRSQATASNTNHPSLKASRFLGEIDDWVMLGKCENV